VFHHAALPLSVIDSLLSRGELVSGGPCYRGEIAARTLYCKQCAVQVCSCSVGCCMRCTEHAFLVAIAGQAAQGPYCCSCSASDRRAACMLAALLRALTWPFHGDVSGEFASKHSTHSSFTLHLFDLIVNSSPSVRCAVVLQQSRGRFLRPWRPRVYVDPAHDRLQHRRGI
jgi:hypothetical protein